MHIEPLVFMVCVLAAVGLVCSFLPKEWRSKQGHNDLSRWKQYGGTLERPGPPPAFRVQGGYTAPPGKRRRPRAPKTGSGVMRG